jgi:hypothetical protein
MTPKKMTDRQRTLGKGSCSSLDAGALAALVILSFALRHRAP